MLRVLAVLTGGLIAVALAWVLAGLPGRVSAEIGRYSFEAATPVVALGLLALFLALYLLARLIGLAITAPARIRRWQRERRRSAGDVAVTRTLLALGAGEAAGARREVARSRRLLGDTPHTLLLAAEAGRLAGREGEAESAFRALAAHPEARFLGLRGLLRQAIARKDWTEAALLARQAEEAHPGTMWLRAERAELAIRTGAWSEALALADADAPKATLAIAAAEAERDPARALRYAKDAWEEDPTLVPAALAYARRLRETGREGRVSEVIRRTWACSPHPDLAAFALAPVADPLGRVQEAKRLAQENPAHPESELMVARASLDAGLTGEARRHAEAAYRAGLQQRRLYVLLADIAEAEGDSLEARTAQRDALRAAADAEADPTWRCEACGTLLPGWCAACPMCDTAGRVTWGAGSRPSGVPGPLTTRSAESV
ncbi:MAG: heme biosynthesis protein HemY [Alphaproteobacteria bacterium]|nr:heme biosynthesis protein HemY [Alphaproteobacteria bacterium]